MNDDPRLGLPSASSFDRDVKCPGNRNLIREMFDGAAPEDFPEEEASEFALRGRRIHRARELGSSFELQDESEIKAYDDGLRLEESALQQWQQDYGIQGYLEGPREQRLWLYHPETLAPMLSGQLDIHYLSDCGRYASIVDWKSGAGKASGAATTSWQLRIQALLLKHEYPGLKHLRAGFIKPETWGQPVSTVNFTEFDLQNIERYVYFVLWQTQQPDAPLSAGPQCDWCPAKAVCEAAARQAALPVAIVPQPAPQKITPKVAAGLVKLVPVESAREVWGRRNAIKNILDAIAARLKALPKEEQYRLSLKLRPGRPADTITDMPAVFAALRRAGYPAKEIWSCLRLNKEAAVEMIQRNLNCRDAEAETTYNLIVGDYLQRIYGEEILSEA